MATLLSANQIPAAGAPGATSPAAVQHTARPAPQPTEFMRELRNILAALSHR